MGINAARKTAVGDRLRGARSEARLSQRKVAELIGLTDRQVRAWENGEVDDYSSIAMKRWADATGKTVDYFLQEPVATQPVRQDHPGIEALRALLFGDPEQRITEAEFDQLRRAEGQGPIIMPGQALDLIVLQRRRPPE